MTGHWLRIAATRAFALVLVVVLALAGLSGTAVALPPAAPVLLGPADGATSVTIPFTISWSAVSGAGGYNWQISKSSDFGTVIERNQALLPGAATTNDVVSGLAAGTYFWRVQAVNPDLEAGPWSSARSVVVTGAGAGVPGSPTLDPPRDAIAFHPLETITFSWSAVPGAVSYVLQESTDPSFPVDTRVRQVNITGTTERVSLNSSNQGSFQARVLAVNADGLAGAPSNLVGFSVSDTNPLPAPPTLQGPANGTTSRLPLTLSWSHVPNHQDDGYQLQISSSSAFSTIEKTFRTSDNQLIVPTLTAGGKFWRVRSQHGYSGATEAYTAFSATGTFTVLSQPLAMGAVTFPAQKFSGGEARGSVDLTGLAPAGGATVALSTNQPALLPELPASVQIGSGTSSSQVLVAPNGFPNSLRGMRVGFVTTPTLVTVTATYNGTSVSTTITLLPPTLNDTPLQLFPVKATGGEDLIGIVDLEVGCFAGFCDGLAPPGGFQVNLSSSSPAATVPATFTIQAGAGGDSFPIHTNPVATRTQVTISARAGGVTASWTLTLTPSPEPAGLKLLPVTTSNGSQGQVTIPLSELAGYDQRVQVTSSNPAVASVPAFATINASTELGRFDITTSPVDVPTDVTISVTGRGVTRSATLTVSPNLPALTGLSVNPSSVPGGTPSTGTVTLGSAAPSGGVSVSLGSNLPGSASVPATVTVPAGATSATFQITTFPVDNTTVQLSAALGDTFQFAALSITRSTSATLSALSLSPTTVAGGNSSTGTVTLSAAAPSGGTVVALSDDSAAASVPASVTVPAAATSRTFTVTTSAVTASTPVVLSAASAGVTRTATLTVNPPTPAAPTLQSPANGATGLVQPVTLDWTDLPNATSYEVTVDDTATIVAPLVANPTVTASQAVVGGLPARQLWWRVRARNAAGVFGPFSATRSFSPQAATGTTSELSSLTLAPPSVTGGASSTGTVTLTTPAPSGGTAVSLTSSNAAVSVPTSVTVPAGQATASFTASTNTVSTQTAVTVTATAAGISRTATLTVNPPASGTLATPSLLSPAVDARFNAGQNVVFDWTDVAGAAGYEIAIDDQSTFSSPTVLRTVTASTFSTSTLPAARMWFRVRALDASGAAGAWSGSRRFEVR
ncbi:MAG: hypothetical protein QOD31_3894 [Pseudonocardiales bacterium]|nr:hypothetical protein [Pseudonocardiales bacterium]